MRISAWSNWRGMVHIYLYMHWDEKKVLLYVAHDVATLSVDRGRRDSVRAPAGTPGSLPSAVLESQIIPERPIPLAVLRKILRQREGACKRELLHSGSLRSHRSVLTFWSELLGILRHRYTNVIVRCSASWYLFGDSFCLPRKLRTLYANLWIFHQFRFSSHWGQFEMIWRDTF